MRLWCSVCLHENQAPAISRINIRDADTIANGQAMCLEHFNRFHDKRNNAGGGVALGMLRYQGFDAPSSS